MGDAEQLAAALLLLPDLLAKSVHPLDRDRPIVNMMRVQLQHLTAAFLYALGHRVAQAARNVGKAAGDDPPRGAAVEADEADYEGFGDAAKERIREIAKDGAHRGLEQVGADVERLLAQANKRAVAWADRRAGELVTSVSQTTRDRVRDLVRQAEEEGWSNDELADAIAGDGVFGDARAERIARTETADADVQGNLIGWKESGLVSQKEWITSKGNPCDECAAKEGQLFDIDDPEGDPPEHPNCECLPAGSLVTAGALLAHHARWFEGELVTITVGDEDLAATPNHPVLTPSGWRPIGTLQVGDDVLQCADPAALVRRVHPDDHHVETRIEEMPRALRMAGRVASVSMPLSAEDFHGDGIDESEVDIVWTARALKHRRVAGGKKHVADAAFRNGHTDWSRLPSDRTGAFFVDAHDAPADSLVGGFGASPTLCGSGARGLSESGVGHGANGESMTTERVAQRGAVTPDLSGKVDARLAGHVPTMQHREVGVREAALKAFRGPDGPVTQSGAVEISNDRVQADPTTGRDLAECLAPHMASVKVVHIRKNRFAGHVYNLSTVDGYYIAGSIVVGNCDTLPVLADEDDAE